jgi:uncharacterized protein involved in exopolysaccharide biosynthesis
MLRDRREQTSGEERLPRVERLVVRDGAQEVLDDELSLLDVWRVLRRHRLLLLATTLLAGLGFSAAALLLTPVYRAEVLLAPVTELDDNQHIGSPLGGFGSLAVLAGIKLDHKDKKNEAIATLNSRRFTERFIEDRKLLPVLFPDLWDERQERWKDDLDQEDIPTLWDAYDKFNETVRRVREDRSTGLVTLSVEWSDPELAAQWANAMVKSVNDSLRSTAVETSNRAISYLQDQLERTTVVDLQQVLHRLVEAEMKKIILASINEEFSFKVIDPAVVPQEPFRPKLLAMATLGVLLGLVTGIILALLVSVVRTGRAKGQGVETAVTRPVEPSPP